MSTGPAAPPPSPMLSPDHKWVWDGTQWQPIADPNEPARKAVFSAFATAAQDLPAPVNTSRPVPAQAGPVGIPYTVIKPSGRHGGNGQASPVLWSPRQSGINRYLYIAAAGVVAVIAIVVLFQFLPFSLPWGTTTDSPQISTTSGPPLKARSDFARADRYLNGILLPALAALNDTLRPVDTGCTGTMTLACSYSLAPAHKQLKQVVSLIDGAVLPDCVTLGVAAIRRDVSGMDVNLASMQAASDQNNQVDVRAYELRYRNGLAALQVHTAAVQPQLATCDSTLTGP